MVIALKDSLWKMKYVLGGTLMFLSLSGSAQESKADDFEQWKKQSAQQFQQYVSAQDQAFAGFLKQKWIKTDVTTDIKKTEKAKVPIAPVAPTEKENNEQQTPKPKQTVKQPSLAKVKAPKIVPVRKLPSPNSLGMEPKSSSESHFQFLNHQLIMPKLPVTRLFDSKPDSNRISDAWLEMSKTNYRNVVKAIVKQSKSLNLDGWGTAIFTYNYVKQQHNQISFSNTNKSQLALYTWFYLVKQGLNVRIAYDDSEVYLLLNTDKRLYAQKYFNVSGAKYYFVDFSGDALPQLNKVYTYQKQHQSGIASLKFKLSKIPLLTPSDVERKISFKYQQETFDIEVNYHKAYVDFLNQYPQLDVKHYFSSELSEQTKQSLLVPLAKIIKGRSEQDALNILLSFVQKGLAYQTDDQQFKQENFMFATEALHYPYADCEDRSVLFSYLVKNLLENKIIGVLYRGHIATAIKLENAIVGASYDVNGDKFYIADPTYIGASVGDVMPGYEAQSPRLIKIN